MPTITVADEMDFDGRNVTIMLPGDREIRICYVAEGMQSGAPSIAIGFPNDQGEWTVLETSAKAFLAAAIAIHGMAARRGEVERYDMARIKVLPPGRTANG